MAKPVADLFDNNLSDQLAKEAPLADRMRPRNWSEFVGHTQVVGEGKPLRQLINKNQLPSLIFWGPPGSGKTTLAHVIANVSQSNYIQLSAVSSGLAELREVIKKAIDNRKFNNKKTILFIDEIHRWSKAQQDSLLPQVEKGVVTLIGATTENPSFEVISALLSRCRTVVLEALTIDNIKAILTQAVKDTSRGFGNYKIKNIDRAVEYIAIMSNGDARTALNTLEIAVNSTLNKNQAVLTEELIKTSLQRSHLLYDKTGEQHYNLISALHKSMRGSDADAALYWLARMLEAGEDPLYIARRLIRFASEDVGLADPNALLQAVAGFEAAHKIGVPECSVNLAQVVAYLARAPKSNALYEAYEKIKLDVASDINEPVPLHLRNAPTKLMKDLGYGKDYKYNPNYKEPVDQDYLPKKLKGKKYLSIK